MIKINVVIARFQVPSLTEGHKELLNKARNKCDHVLILLGCSDLDGKTAENPLLFLQRKAAVERAAANINLLASCYTVMPLRGSKSNKEWTQRVDDMIYTLWPDAEATIWVGRDSVVPACYMGRANIELLEETKSISGTETRKLLRPSTNEDFLRGQAFALQFQFPHAYQCVDVGVIKNGSVLLIQRGDTGSWCLPGGFVDPTDANLESAARRELLEETKLSCEGDMEYIASMLIDDWRYRGRDKIMTALFGMPYAFGQPYVTDEATAFEWVSLSSDFSFVSESHQPLVKALQRHYLKPQHTPVFVGYRAGEPAEIVTDQEAV